MKPEIIKGIETRLKRIKALAIEIKDVPNLLPDVWTMRKVDEKCQEIIDDTEWIKDKLRGDCGEGGQQTDWPSSKTDW